MSLPTLRLFLTGLFVTFGGSFQYGFQLSYINPTEEAYIHFFNNSYFSHYGHFLEDSIFRLLWAFTTGVLCIGAIFGAVFMPTIAEKLGRKRGLYVSSLIILLAALPSAFSYHLNSFELFTFGRFLYGAGVGLASGLQTMYLSEISPVEFCGLMGTMTGLMIELGFTCGAAIGVPTLLGTETRWPWIFCFESVPSALLILVLLCSAESPFYLLSKGHNTEATNSLLLHHGQYAAVEQLLALMKEKQEKNQEASGIVELLRTKLARKGTLMGVVSHIAVAFSGIMAIGFFSTHLLKETGLSHLQAAYANIGITGASFVGALLSLLTIERCGRRPLLLVSCGLLCLANVAMLVLMLVSETVQTDMIGYLFFVVACFLTVVFGLGLASIPWFLATELVPQSSKAAATSVSVIAQYVGGVISPILFYPLEGIIGAWSFLLFAVPLALIAVYFYFALPETKNQELDVVLAKLYDDYIPPECVEFIEK